MWRVFKYILLCSLLFNELYNCYRSRSFNSHQCFLIVALIIVKLYYLQSQSLYCLDLEIFLLYSHYTRRSFDLTLCFLQNQDVLYHHWVNFSLNTTNFFSFNNHFLTINEDLRLLLLQFLYVDSNLLFTVQNHHSTTWGWQAGFDILFTQIIIGLAIRRRS